MNDRLLLLKEAKTHRFRPVRASVSLRSFYTPVDYFTRFLDVSFLSALHSMLMLLLQEHNIISQFKESRNLFKLKAEVQVRLR